MATLEPELTQHITLDATRHSRQTPDKEAKINHITVYYRGYTETDPSGTLSPNLSRLSGPAE
jgi:hypothetical protein